MMIEIIIFAIIAFVLFFKLKSILGEEYDDEMFGYNSKKRKKENIKEAEYIKTETNEYNTENYQSLDNNSKEIYKELCEKIDGFSLEKFAIIASKVMESVLKANETKNKEDINSLLEKDLAKSIISSFDETEQHHTILVSIDETKIENITKVRNLYKICVIFSTQQIDYTTNNDDNNKEVIINGSKYDVIKVKERWSFVHDISSKDKTWFIDNIDEV